VTCLALQSRCRGLRESNSSRLEEPPPLVGSILPVFGVASSMRLIHLLGCILVFLSCTVTVFAACYWNCITGDADISSVYSLQCGNAANLAAHVVCFPLHRSDLRCTHASLRPQCSKAWPKTKSSLILSHFHLCRLFCRWRAPEATPRPAADVAAEAMHQTMI
jgi:hypothetical protein